MKYMTFAMAVGVMAGVAFAGAPVELKNAALGDDSILYGDLAMIKGLK